MASDMRAGGARGLGAAVVLGLALLGASSAARADGSYTFTLTPLSGNGANASGMFTLGTLSGTSIALFTSVDATLYSNGVAYSIDQVIRGSNISPRGIGGVFLGAGSSLGISGMPAVAFNEIRGSVNTVYGVNNQYYDGSSFFDAVLNPGGGSSGGAPAPEVNAALSLIIAGATVAFLRRKRGGRPGSAAAC